nr:prostamide/prostaglandin F synthase-like [Lytechinus pictus]
MSIMKAVFSAKTRAALSRASDKNIKANMKGEKLQIGGTLIIGKGGEVLEDFKQEAPGDHIPLQTVLNAFGIKAEAPKTDGAEGGAVVCNDDVCQMK